MAARNHSIFGITYETDRKLRGIPLKSVLERLESEKEIWFRGDPSLLEKEVTVHFTELLFEEGLKRILASTNYSLIYDGNGRPTGVVVIGKGTADHAVSEGTPGAEGKSILPPDTNQQVHIKGSFTVIRNVPPPGDYVKVTAEERENFTVIRNTPPPGGPFEVSAEELEHFKVIKNCPPPGT